MKLSGLWLLQGLQRMDNINVSFPCNKIGWKAKLCSSSKSSVLLDETTCSSILLLFFTSCVIMENILII